MLVSFRCGSAGSKAAPPCSSKARRDFSVRLAGRFSLRFWRPALWQGQRASNPQPLVLETSALPIELCPCSCNCLHYSMILATTPAPTVRPPSRMAKRRPSSIAIGLISLTVMLTLSPGITISLSFGSSTAPVTSVVRK